LFDIQRLKFKAAVFFKCGRGFAKNDRIIFFIADKNVILLMRECLRIRLASAKNPSRGVEAAAGDQRIEWKYAAFGDALNRDALADYSNRSNRFARQADS